MDFPEVFSESLLSSGVGKAAFAKAVRVSPGFISQVLSGERPPPLDRIPEWADALKLKGEKYSRFVNAAISRHVPESLLKAAKAHSLMLEHWLAEERGDTGPWHLDLHGKLTESPRARELKQLRQKVEELEASRRAATQGSKLDPAARIADLERENAALRARLDAVIAAAGSTATGARGPKPRRMIPRRSPVTPPP